MAIDVFVQRVPDDVSHCLGTNEKLIHRVQWPGEIALLKTIQHVDDDLADLSYGFGFELRRQLVA